MEIVEGDKFPTNLPNWEENQERFVLANAEKGAYKYSVKLKASPGMKRDPIVVVD